MRPIPQSLQAHLETGSTTLAWCWRLTRADEAVYGFTDHDHDLSFAGTAYEAASGFTASDIGSAIGLSVDNVDIGGALQSGRLAKEDLEAGLFDGARVDIWRVNWMDPQQHVLVFSGTIGEVRCGAHAFTAELRGLAHYLGQDTGRTYQYACDSAAGDRRCGIAISTSEYCGHGTVVHADTPYQFTAAGLDSYALGWFAGGVVEWSSGGNSGRRIEVKRHTLTFDGSALIELWRSMPQSIATGDAFSVTAGCDKTFSTCRAKFANGMNFRGFPHIPGNSYVLGVPSPGNPANDGGSISR